MDSADESFNQVFRENLKIARIPFPDNPIVTLGSILVAIKEVAEGLKIAGDRPVGIIFKDLRMALPASVGVAAGAAELGTVVVDAATIGAAMVGSFYIGVIAGVALEAAVEVYGVGPAIAFGHKVKASISGFQRSLEQFISIGIQSHPAAMSFGPRATPLARMVDAAPRTIPKRTPISELERHH